MNSAVVSVTTSPTALNTASSDVGAQFSPDNLLIQVPVGGATVYVGGTAVTADTAATGGVTVKAGETLSLPLASGEIAYGIVAASTQSVAVLRTGV